MTRVLWPKVLLGIAMAVVISGQVLTASDSAAPTVCITTPVEREVVYGTRTIAATASDNIGVVGVQFQVDGANLGEEDATPPYGVVWDSKTVLGGVHYLTAVARDAAGNRATSAKVAVTSLYRAFTDSSYWNSPIPPNAPVDPNSGKIIAFLHADNKSPYVKFAGLIPSGAWGRPIYWGTAADPVYNVACTDPALYPPELTAVHIPLNVEADATTSDSAMTVYDLVQGFVIGFHRMKKTVAPDGSISWSCQGADCHYLDSNGLDRKWAQFPETDPRNCYHRGCPASSIGIRWDEYQAGVIPHKLNLFVNTTKNTHVFPYINDESGTTNPDAPPEGTLIRIKPSVKLDALGLSPAGLMVARMLQTYGAVIGDQSGGPMCLKVENTVAEGRGQLWTGVLDLDALSAIPIEDYEIIQLGYGCGTCELCTPVEQDQP